MSAHGSFEMVDGRPALRFERRLGHPVERVWRALTEAGDLAQWFPERVDADWREGGTIRFSDGAGAGRIHVFDPPRRLHYGWYGNELRFELEPDGDGDGATLLRMTALLDDRRAAARDAAGWHVCLDSLQQALATGDAEAPGPRPTPEWRALFRDYLGRGLPEGAPVPDGA